MRGFSVLCFWVAVVCYGGLAGVLAEEPLTVCVQFAPESHQSRPFDIELRFSSVIERLSEGSVQVSSARFVSAAADDDDPTLWRLRLSPAWSADALLWIFPAPRCSLRTICAADGRRLSTHSIVRLPARPGPYRFVWRSCVKEGSEE